MRNSPTYRCHVGSAGWQHADWLGSFYPEDLPPEWELTFYNNVFSCVYLDYADWATRSGAELSAWVEDTHDRFRFVLGLGPGGFDGEARSRAEVLEPRLGALVDAAGAVVPGGNSANIVWLNEELDLRELARQIAILLGTQGEIYLISRSHDLSTMNEVKTLLEIMGL
jgi:hypothetical protein